MTVTEYREQKKEQAKQLSKHTKGDLVDKLLFAYDTIKRLEAKLQNKSSNCDYAKSCDFCADKSEAEFSICQPCLDRLISEGN